MQKIVPHLWFDTQAKAAADFYVSIFPDSKIKYYSVIKNTPSGDSEILSFEVSGYSFMAISAGPYFKINPSVSFMLNFDPSKDTQAKESLTTLWEKLVDGGKVLMPVQEYPFSKYYGWVEDKFGVSWQLILTNPDGEERPFIVPSIMFVGDLSGKAEEATDFYLSVFKHGGKDVKRGTLARYPAGMQPDMEGKVMFTDFNILGQWFASMDSGVVHDFSFSEAVSFMVSCDTQEEIDYYWEQLSFVPESEQCGWLKDKYGLSWQIIPKRMNEMLSQGTPEQSARVTQAFLKMKKFDIATLEKAYKGE